MSPNAPAFANALAPTWDAQQQVLTFEEETHTAGGRQEVQLALWPCPWARTRATCGEPWSEPRAIDRAGSLVVEHDLADAFAALAEESLSPTTPVRRALESVPEAVRSELLPRLRTNQLPAALLLASLHPGFCALLQESSLLALLLVEHLVDCGSRRRRDALLHGIRDALAQPDSRIRVRSVARFLPLSTRVASLEVIAKATAQSIEQWSWASIAQLEALTESTDALSILRSLSRIPSHLPGFLLLLSRCEGGLRSQSPRLFEALTDASDTEAAPVMTALRRAVGVQEALGRPLDTRGIRSVPALRTLLARQAAAVLERFTRGLSLDTPAPLPAPEHPQPERDPSRLRRALAVLFRAQRGCTDQELVRIWSGSSTVVHLHGPDLPHGGWALVDRSDCGRAWALRMACSTLGDPLPHTATEPLQASLRAHSGPRVPQHQWRGEHWRAFESSRAQARTLPGRTWVAVASPTPHGHAQLRLLHGPLDSGRVHTLSTLPARSLSSPPWSAP